MNRNSRIFFRFCFILFVIFGTLLYRVKFLFLLINPKIRSSKPNKKTFCGLSTMLYCTFGTIILSLLVGFYYSVYSVLFCVNLNFLNKVLVNFILFIGFLSLIKKEECSYKIKFSTVFYNLFFLSRFVYNLSVSWVFFLKHNISLSYVWLYKLKRLSYLYLEFLYRSLEVLYTSQWLTQIPALGFIFLIF